MKTIVIKQVVLSNFKGIRSLTITFSDEGIRLKGQNASGKTSVYDAYTWLLFNIDSHGSSNPWVRPVDADGKWIDDIEVSVEATLEVDGEIIVLKKTQTQVWQTKRGETVSEYKGDTNSYSINGFPCTTQREFNEKVESIMEQSRFKLLSDPTWFINLKEAEQRSILFELIPGLDDANILEMDADKYEPVKADILMAGPDKCREKEMRELRALKSDLTTYPIRIDECQRSFRMVGGTEEYLTDQKQKLENEIKKIRSDRDGLTDNTSLMADINKEMMAVKGKMSEIERNANDGLRKKTADAYKAFADSNQEYKLLRGKIDRTEHAIVEIKRSIKSGEAEVSSLAEKWKTVKARVLPERETICPTCGRPFEADKAEEIKAEFEKRKGADLAAIEGRGKAARAEVSDMKAKLEEFETALKADKIKVLEVLDAIDGLEAAYDALKGQPYVDVSQDPEYKEMSEKLDALNVTFIQLQEGSEADKKPYDEAEQKALSALNAVNEELATIQANRHLEVRIAELKTEQRKCSQQIADKEMRLYLIEEFIKLKMDLLSNQVNSHFKTVRFKLFETQKNGAVVPCCVMQCNSNGSFVDFKRTNHSAMILGGLDIINALSELYQVKVPVFIDNAEAINSYLIPKMDTQMILLTVSDDTGLTLEDL